MRKDRALSSRPALGLLLASVFLGAPAIARAEVVRAASCMLDDVQDAVDTADAGDTVEIPEGECAWDGRVDWRDKSIAVVGAGIGRTVIDCAGCFRVMSTASTSEHSQFRISGMTLRGESPGGIVIEIWDNVGSSHYGWRIDHLRLEYPGAGSGYGIFVGGPTYGLVDHNEFAWGNGLAIIVSAQLDSEYPATRESPQGGYLLAQPLAMGTIDAVYIEDNTFTSVVDGGCAAYDTSSGGGRAVFRHNTLTGCMYYSHWTRGAEIGGILHEIYGNTFTGNAAFGAFPIRIEAGTGVVFDNTIVDFDESYAVLDERRGRGSLESGDEWGACDGTQPWDGNAGDPGAPGWPCLGQIGRAPGHSIAELIAGATQASAPLHLWNNGPEAGCSTGGACTDELGVNVYGDAAYVSAEPHPNGEVDYVLGVAAPGYAPFTYPHPLAGGAPIETDGGVIAGDASVLPDDGAVRADAGALADAGARPTDDAAAGGPDAGAPPVAGSGCGCRARRGRDAGAWTVLAVVLALTCRRRSTSR
jgi:hypothetical protein